MGYCFAIHPLEPVTQLSPAFRLVGNHIDDVPAAPIDTGGWKAAWTPREEALCANHLRCGTADAAWALSSASAESLLADGPRASCDRADPPRFVRPPRRALRRLAAGACLTRCLFHLYHRTRLHQPLSIPLRRTWARSSVGLVRRLPVLGTLAAPLLDTRLIILFSCATDPVSSL